MSNSVYNCLPTDNNNNNNSLNLSTTSLNSSNLFNTYDYRLNCFIVPAVVTSTFNVPNSQQKSNGQQIEQRQYVESQQHLQIRNDPYQPQQCYQPQHNQQNLQEQERLYIPNQLPQNTVNYEQKEIKYQESENELVSVLFIKWIKM